MKLLIASIFLSVLFATPLTSQLNDEHGSGRKLSMNHLVEVSLSKELAVCPHHASRQKV